MKRLAPIALLGAAAFSQSGAPTPPGSPLPGITSHELELFRLGREDFVEVESADDGLGPAFNGNSCAVCHSVPAVGGISAMTEIRGGYRDEDGKFHALHGGTLYHLFSIPDHRCQVQIPPEANVIGRRAPIPLFGAGLIEAIPDETLLALEDPDDRDHDGVRGRVARIFDVATQRQRIGRFGWKAQQATLLAFSGDAYRNEMGITNDLFPDELALGISADQMKLCNPKRGIQDVRNRATGLRGIDNFDNFMRLLAPITPSASHPDGEFLFTQIGCATCHVPVLHTGPNTNPIFDRKPVPLYSDLLLHDVGTGDGIEQEAATGDEFRTPALWGLRYRKPLLHDGSAPTIESAIQRHAAEAQNSIARFIALTPLERAQLLTFLAAL
jgi:CxxC motif-containing protein (DUF1111 family)